MDGASTVDPFLPRASSRRLIGPGTDSLQRRRAVAEQSMLHHTILECSVGEGRVGSHRPHRASRYLVRTAVHTGLVSPNSLYAYVRSVWTTSYPPNAAQTFQTSLNREQIPGRTWRQGTGAVVMFYKRFGSLATLVSLGDTSTLHTKTRRSRSRHRPLFSFTYPFVSRSGGGWRDASGGGDAVETINACRTPALSLLGSGPTEAAVVEARGRTAPPMTSTHILISVGQMFRFIRRGPQLCQKLETSINVQAS